MTRGLGYATGNLSHVETWGDLAEVVDAMLGQLRTGGLTDTQFARARWHVYEAPDGPSLLLAVPLRGDELAAIEGTQP